MRTEHFRVLTGLDYPPHGDAGAGERRAEPGDVVDDLPPQSVGWLLGGGHVEALAESADSAAPAPAPAPGLPAEELPALIAALDGFAPQPKGEPQPLGDAGGGV